MEQKLRAADLEIYYPAEDEKAALFLQKQLLERLPPSGDLPVSNKIFLKTDPALRRDIQITTAKGSLILKAKNERKMTWLLYQFLSSLAEKSPSFEANDLPPPLLSFNKNMARTFAFEYMEPYLSPNLRDRNHQIFGTNYLEADWGIWGHNLSDVLKPDTGNDIFARVNGVINKNQFCFSSPELYRQLRDYVEDSGSEYFMLMPRDNRLVCTCDRCKALGNTEVSATPSVSFLVEKIAREFPKKKFFTSSYHSTTEPPVKKLPDNTGVMISTIRFPLNVNLDASDFKNLVRSWQKKVPRVFVWDYVSNFDDYLSPFPVIQVMKKRLQLYKKIGVEGVFLNGSGYDFASSQRYKTFMLSSLMFDPDLDTSLLSQKYFSKHYPGTGAILHRYFISLENALAKSGKDLRIYASMQQNVWSYLDPADFFTFFEEIERAKPATEQESERVAQLRVALHFTWLQLRMLHGFEKYGWAKKQGSRIIFDPELEKKLTFLEQESKLHNISVYTETGATIADYVQLYRNFIQQKSIENILISTEIKRVDGISAYQKSFLNDGVFGFPTDKHIGWVQIPQGFSVGFKGSEKWGPKTLSANFLILENYGIYAPEEIQLYKNGVLLHSIIPTEQEGPSRSRYASFKANLEINENDEILVKVILPEKSGTNITAIDELILN